MGADVASFDSAVPVLIFKIGRYPLSHGTLGAIRSLGRVGLPVYAASEDRLVPYAFSRFLSGHAVLPTTGQESEEVLLLELSRLATRLGRPSLLIPTDDEAAIFVAEQGASLRSNFILPAIQPGLARSLASKRTLSQLCEQYGVAMPATQFAKSVEDVLAFAENAQFPVVVKNSEPWVRITIPAVRSTTIVDSRRALVSLARTWVRNPQVILQEYIPRSRSEDWIFHGYFDRNCEPLVAFTGMKQRSWPPHTGVTAVGVALPNAELARMATVFCRDLGYRGIVDMDWRLDLRDGRFKLVDFNPRMGANFRLFVNAADIDVVRAQHLDLTGRGVPTTTQIFGRKLIVENMNAASRLMGGPGHAIHVPQAARQTEFAWFAWDDPLPFFAMALRFGAHVANRLVSLLLAKGSRLAVRARRFSSLELPIANSCFDEKSANRTSGELGPADKSH
jgi:predicted ATP-grasp superfamily ATP-dependent carboligase